MSQDDIVECTVCREVLGINACASKLNELESKLAESNERFKMIHSILSGGGVLGYRVDKAIRKIEKWQGITDEQ